NCFLLFPCFTGGGSGAQRRVSRGKWIAAAAAALAGGGALYWQRPPPAPLPHQDALVPPHFPNTPGDPIFHSTLPEALAVQLEQSPFLKIVSDDVMRGDLALMGRKIGEPVNNELAHAICVRESVKAMIGGSITSIGRTYAITLQATNCESGDTLAR